MQYNIPYINSNYVSPLAAKTPAPKTADAMRNDIGERFAGMVWIKEDKSIVLDDYFIEYDYWEEYSDNKKYTSDTYQAAYKGVMRQYQNYLCLVSGDDGDKYYVAAKRIPGELESLEKFCTCFICSCNVFNPLKYLWCPHCTGCIKAGIGCAKKEYIIKAHERKQQSLTVVKRQNKYLAYIPQFQWLKIIEIVTLLIMAYLSYYIIS